MTQMPGLAGADEAPDELPIDELGAPAGAASSAAHQAARDDWRPPCSSSAMDRARVLRVGESSRAVTAPSRAVALVLRDRLVLAEAELALPCPVPEGHSPA